MLSKIKRDGIHRSLTRHGLTVHAPAVCATTI